MIGIGFSTGRKVETVGAYVAEHGITKVVVLHPDSFTLDVLDAEHVEWSEIIMYRTYYRLLQAVGRQTLVVVNECLRTQNRHDLTYNCIRHVLAQTPHVHVFQGRPLIDTIEDFGTLFDFATRSQWKRVPFDDLPLTEAKIIVEPQHYAVRPIQIEATAKVKARYAKEKRHRIDTIGLRDPHTIPRNLHLLGGKDRASAIEPGRTYVARNGRIKHDQLVTYATVDGPATVLDFPHRFIDWADFLTRTGQTEVDAVVTDLKVDQWYLERFRSWCQRVNDGQAALHP